MKKVLCIVDCYNWALNNRAVALKSEYSEHNFEIKHFKDLGGISLLSKLADSRIYIWENISKKKQKI